MIDIKKEFKFLDTPKFNYIYRNEVQILGRKLNHIGEGIFMFEEPFVSDELSMDQFMEKIEDYKDILFIKFYTYLHDDEDVETWSNIFRDDKKKWIIPFAVSVTHRRFSRFEIECCAEEYMKGFNIPDSMKWIINDVADNYLKKEKSGHGCEEVCYKKDVYYNEAFCCWTSPIDDECTYLLDPKHNTDGGRYIFVNGFVGRKIFEGIYYFDEPVSLISLVNGRTSPPIFRNKERLHVGDLHHYDFKENIAFIDKMIIDIHGTLDSYFPEEYSVYYLAIGDSAISVLSRLYKYLSGYELHFMNKDAAKVKNDPVFVHLGDLDEEFKERERRRRDLAEELQKRERRRRPISIPEGAHELIEGMGFHNLDVRCKLLFQNIGKKDATNNQGFSKYEVAYILDGKLHLVNYSLHYEKEEGYVFDLRIVSELSVRYKVRLFDHVEEDIVQVVIENRNAERLIIGEEEFSAYLNYVAEKY